MDLVCSECGSSDVWHDAYVAVNDHASVRIFDEVYCDDCDGFTSLMKRSEFDQKE